MKKYLVIISILFFAPNFLLAQNYSGIVIDKVSNVPLPYANIFQEGTLNGTITNFEGQFEFKIVDNLSAPVVISFVGYATKILSLQEIALEPVISMEKLVLDINEVDVKSGKSAWPREKMLRVFKEEFLGTSYNAQSCKIKNENDIYLFYNDDTKVLHANSQKPIEIENRLLGYTIYYLLENFRRSYQGVQFTGYSRFEEADFRNERRKIKIEKQRRDTYLGSIKHFIRFLYRHKLHQNDTIYDLQVINNMYNYHTAVRDLLYTSVGDELNSTFLLSKNEANNDYLREFEHKFQLYFEKDKYLSIDNLILESVDRKEIFAADTIQIIYLGNLQRSMMLAKQGLVEIFENGYFNPEQISWGGAMGRKRVGDLLPLEYKYDKTVMNK